MSSESVPRMFSASCYDNRKSIDDGLSAPLIERTHRRKARGVDNGAAIDVNRESTSVVPNVKLYEGSRRVLWLGLVLGFAVQILSLLSYRHLLLDYDGKTKRSGTTDGSNNESSSFPSTLSFSDWIHYVGLHLMSKMDLFVYIWIWMVVTISLTRTKLIPRVLVLSSLYCFDPAVTSSSSSSNSNNASGENIKVARIVGIHCFVGIVLGNLLAWIVMDGWLGFPVPLEPILGVAALDSSLCCLLMWSFNKFVVQDDEDDDDDDDDYDDEEEEDVEQNNDNGTSYVLSS